MPANLPADLVLDDLLAVIAFALLFAPHLPFPSSALFMLYSIIMAFAAYNLMGPFLSWLSTKPDWFEKKPKWAKYMPGEYLVADCPRDTRKARTEEEARGCPGRNPLRALASMCLSASSVTSACCVLWIGRLDRACFA